MSFTVFFLLSLYSPNCLWTDFSSFDQASLFHLMLILLLFSLFSYMPIFIWFDLCLWICSHLFVQLFRHYKSLPFHAVIRIFLISLSCHSSVFCYLIYLYGAMLVLVFMLSCDLVLRVLLNSWTCTWLAC